MSDKPNIPLSRLRELHQQAKAYYVNWGDSLPDIFRRYVHAEIQERTVEALQAELAALQAQVAALEGELLEALTELVGWRAIYGGDIGALQQRARELMKEGSHE